MRAGQRTAITVAVIRIGVPLILLVGALWWYEGRVAKLTTEAFKKSVAEEQRWVQEWPVLVREDDFSQLGDAPRTLLRDPGWFQPYIEPGRKGSAAGAGASGAPAPTSLRTEVEVDAPLNREGDAYVALAKKTPGNKAICLLKLAARVSGGQTYAGGRYRYITWAFRDGTVLVDKTAYKDDTLESGHIYELQLADRSKFPESTYVVRVQVVDAAGQVAYGDSLPIVVRLAGVAYPEE
jgi:hypothetical protein